MINNVESYEIRNSKMFALNITVQDCRDATKGVAGFRETCKNGIICFNYDFCHRDTFPDPELEKDAQKAFLLKVRRECRGILFEQATGKLLCRKLHKFFNVNEMDETHPSKIDLNEPFQLLEKLDGSLIAPFYYGDKVCWGSKSGPTDLSDKVERYIERMLTPADTTTAPIKFNEFSKHWLTRGFTPLYEWCSESNQIVLYYATDKLSLISLRNMSTGEYMDVPTMKQTCLEYNVPMVNTIDIESHPVFSSPYKNKNTQELLTCVQKMEGVEGYILKFESGKIYKLKSEWYFGLSHAGPSTRFTHEKDVWALILSGTLDDTIAKIASIGPIPERYKNIQSFSVTLYQRIEQVSIKAIESTIKAKRDGKQRRHITNDPTIDTQSKKILFLFYDRISELDSVQDHLSDVSSHIIDKIKVLCNNSSKLEEARNILGKDIKYKDI
ncbi:hypothetical protein CYY_002095 [Polysphondylium violaceum]|uniref:T4 RNA ligase 1-like N-terminal domain-containing protein n=1 Tax=Polysphondylium violaceum TaxID=133409 RepID=A0A8J4Q0N9_9MYCE|nr:hypothetical protein CYY_002095 [Polysphondylium violaceum]